MLFSIHPLLSILLSLLVINGFYNLSKIISEIKYLNFLNRYIAQGRIIIFFFVVNFFSVFFYNSFLFLGVNKLFLQIAIILLILIGFYKSPLFKDAQTKLQLINSKLAFLLFILIFGYFLISLLPISDPDSLDYHLTVPYLSLLNERFFIEKEWFTSQLSGAGEALIIFSLSINAYKFSSILQFVSLFAIIIAIINLKLKKLLFSYDSKILICLSILCIPAFLFLTFTAKPQLFSIATNFIAFLIVFFLLPHESNKKNSIILFAIVSFLCLCSTQFKFSFFLSSGIIILFAFYEMYKKNILATSLAVTLFFAMIIILPREYYDYSYFSTDIVKNFFQPVTDDYISEYFVTSLKHGSGNPRYFPYWLFLPIYLGKFSPGVITEIIGLSVLILFINFQLGKINKIFIASTIFFILGIILGQPIGRFFIEPFLWLLTGSLYYIGLKKTYLLEVSRKFLTINSIAIIIVMIFAIKDFLPGVFSIEQYKNILRKYGEGYALYEWANKTLPVNSILLTSHRSYLFSKYPFVSYEFRLFVRNQEQLNYFTNLVASKKPTHLLYNGVDRNLVTDLLKNCRGELVSVGKKVSKTATRNSLARNNRYYDGYIYQIDLSKLKKCKKK